MLGRDHALSGALVGLTAAAPLSRALGTPRLSPGELAAAAAVTAGLALLPDIDEPGSTISLKLGPLSRGVAVMTKKVAGGHRQATHSLVLAMAASAAADLAAHTVYGAPVTLWAALALILALIVPGIRRRGLTATLLPVAGAGGLLHVETGSWLPRKQLVLAHPMSWLPWAVGLGVLCHLTGDLLTQAGVPVFWPWREHIAIPLLGHTASLRERVIGLALLAGILLCGWLWVVHPELAIGRQLADQVHNAVASVGHAVATLGQFHERVHGVSSGRSLLSRGVRRR